MAHAAAPGRGVLQRGACTLPQQQKHFSTPCHPDQTLSPLLGVASSPPQEAVQVLLKHSADVNSRDKYWQTPLHIAAANKAVRCAEALIPLLSNVNVSERAGRTALHHAAFSGHLEVRQD